MEKNRGYPARKELHARSQGVLTTYRSIRSRRVICNFIWYKHFLLLKSRGPKFTLWIKAIWIPIAAPKVSPTWLRRMREWYLELDKTSRKSSQSPNGYSKKEKKGKERKASSECQSFMFRVVNTRGKESELNFINSSQSPHSRVAEILKYFINLQCWKTQQHRTGTDRHRPAQNNARDIKCEMNYAKWNPEYVLRN